MKLPSIHKSQSAPVLSTQQQKRGTDRKTLKGRSMLAGNNDFAWEQSGVVPSSCSRAPPNPEMRRKVLEALTQPDVKGLAQKFYERELPDRPSGRLGMAELRKALKSLNEHLHIPVPSQAVTEQLFKRFDFNGDGGLNFEEFYELFVTSLRRFAFDRSTLMGRDIFVAKQGGKVWDHFKCVKKLGSGSFGAVYLATDKRTGDERVVKAAGKSQVKLPVEDVEREIMVMLQLDHPHVIRLYSWYEGSGSIYLVLDALKGGTLHDVVLQKCQGKDRGIPEDWIRIVMRQSLEAMAYCHSKRVIHKDIKDENIMLLKKDPDYSEPYVVIIDLGVSEMFGLADPKGKMQAGTPTTMAPEVWNGSFGPKCDVWSLGCVFFEMSAGDMPFCARSFDPKDWRALQKHGPKWDLVKISKEGKDLCKQMLTFGERERPTMTDCLAHRWFGATVDLAKEVPAQQFSSLQRFSEQTAVKRALCYEMAARLPMEHAHRIAKYFKAVDENRDGHISRAELESGFRKMGLKDPKLIEKTFEVLDVDGDGILSLNEFAAGVLMNFQDLLEERFQALFRKYDEDYDGFLDRSELQKFLSGALQLSTKSQDKRPAALLDDLHKEYGEKVCYEDLRRKLMA